MNIDSSKYILLFECCQLTKGQSRTLLIDFQRKKIEFLDNELYDIFTSNTNRIIREILDGYDRDTQKIIIEYFIYLIESEYAFLCEKEELAFFPKINLDWHNPSHITNCIIDFDAAPKDLNPYFDFLSELDSLGCENLQIRCYKKIPLDVLENILVFINKTIIHRIELILKYDAVFKNDYKHLISKFPRVNELILHSADIDSRVPLLTSQLLYFTTQKIDGSNCCGKISPQYFNLNFEHYLESNNYNTCLNRKIAIDVNGDIKNCPSLKNSYGSIYKNTLQNVIADPFFLKGWGIKKDLIKTCNVCEFRHVCTDCRAYLNDDLSLEKPLKCNYNPFTMIWE